MATRQLVFELVRKVLSGDQLMRWISNSAIVATGMVALVISCAIPAVDAPLIALEMGVGGLTSGM